MDQSPSKSILKQDVAKETENILYKEVEKLLKSDKKDCAIEGVDLSAWPDVFKKLKDMQKLRVLKIEGCKLETFAPSALPSSVKHLSLQQNNIASLDSIVFGQEVPGLRDSQPSKGLSAEVRLLSLDLSCNKLTVFPFASLHLQKDLKILDLSRNQITKLEEKHRIDEDGNEVASGGFFSSGK